VMGESVGTHGEIERKKRGNRVEKKKPQHPPPPPPPPPPKPIGPPGCMLPHLIGCKELYCISMFLVTFWPRLMEGT